MEHHHPVAVVGDDPKVLRHQQDRRAGVLHRLPHLVEELRLDRDVEAGGGLVRDQQARVRRQRHGDQRPLRHAARELVRVGRHPPLGVVDADLAQHVDGALAGRRAAHVVVGAVDVADLAAHPQHRVQRTARVLHDDADILAAEPAERLLVLGQQVLAAEEHLSPRDTPRRAHDAHQRQRRGGLARPRVAHQPHDLALADRQREIRERADRPLGRAVGDAQPLGAEHLRGKGPGALEVGCRRLKHRSAAPARCRGSRSRTPSARSRCRGRPRATIRPG